MPAPCVEPLQPQFLTKDGPQASRRHTFRSPVATDLQLQDQIRSVLRLVNGRSPFPVRFNVRRTSVAGTQESGFRLSGMKRSPAPEPSRLSAPRPTGANAPPDLDSDGRDKNDASRVDALITGALGLHAGDFVVHANHGIGRFEGLTRLDADGTRDFFTIAFQDGKVLVPVENADLLSRYGSADSTVRLDRLGGKAWVSRKGRLKKRIG